VNIKPLTLLRDPVFTPSDITRIFTKAVDLEAGGDEISYTDYIANVQNQIKKIFLDIFNEINH